MTGPGRLPYIRALRLAPFVGSILLLDTVAAVGLRLRRVRGPVSLDVRTARPVFSHPFGVAIVPARLAHEVVKLGSPLSFAVLVIALAVGAAWTRYWPGVAIALVAPPLAVTAAEHLKAHFGRTEGGGDAYPSGHTAAISVLAVVLVIVAWRRWGARSLAITLPVGALASAAMVVAVVRLHDHLMSDAIGGVLLGAGVAGAVYGVISAAAGPLEGP